MNKTLSDASVRNVSLSSRRVKRSPLDDAAGLPSAESSLARPTTWLGAKSRFGLALPEAKPTSSQLYAPRGVWLDKQRLIVCDSGNHRVLIWQTVPTTDGQPADIVLGQVDFEHEGPAQGCGVYERGMHLPSGAVVADGRLIVADAWHHRLLVWNQLPSNHNQPADYAIGQSDLVSIQPNRGSAPSATSLYWPYGVAWIDGRLYVADTGNRRVLAWHGIPTSSQPADLVLGQPDAFSTEENRGGPASARSFRWPHAIAGDRHQLWIADAGNHRLLGWDHQPTSDVEACWVVGQPNMQSTIENPYTAQSERTLRFPTDCACKTINCSWRTQPIIAYCSGSCPLTKRTSAVLQMLSGRKTLNPLVKTIGKP